jgi:hypothetical protein
MNARIFRMSCLLSSVAMSMYALGAPLKWSMKTALGG